MNDPRTQLKDLIHVEKGIIPANLCDHIIQDIETREWRPHTWYNAVQGSFGSEETMELDVQSITPELQQLLTPIMIQAGAAYNQKYAYLRCERTEQIMNNISTIRFNRYEIGTKMRKHYDHIHSIFDGKKRGVPLVSIVGNLNEEYEGSEFTCRDTTIKLKTGDILMFPSNFMYPHEVTECTKGTRYSFVSWAF